MRKHGFDFPSFGGGIWRESCVERRCLGLHLVIEGNTTLWGLGQMGVNKKPDFVSNRRLFACKLMNETVRSSLCLFFRVQYIYEV